eukprot:3081788-Pleurochrysis_carterae.AAC.1
MTHTGQTKAKGGSPNHWPDLIGIVHWHVCISPVQRVLIYDESKFANLYYMPSDGFSTPEAHPDGYGYDSAPHSLISLMTPEYEPRPSITLVACAISRPERRVYISVWVVMHDATYFASIGITSIRFAHLASRPTLERVGRIIWSAGIRLPGLLPSLADESAPSMAYFAIDACQSTPIAVSATRDLIFINRGR